MKRFHVHVAVSNLAESTRFYSAMFGTEPSVLKTDYAKWMLDDPLINFAISELGVGFDLKAQMIDTRRAAALGNGEVDEWIIEHPFCVIGFQHARFCAEHGGIKTCAFGKIADGDVDVKAFHDLLRLTVVTRDFFERADSVGVRQMPFDLLAGAHPAPAQQFSVRYAMRSSMVAKLAA